MEYQWVIEHYKSASESYPPVEEKKKGNTPKNTQATFTSKEIVLNNTND